MFAYISGGPTTFIVASNLILLELGCDTHESTHLLLQSVTKYVLQMHLLLL